jgi:glycosyltransferase involved in cell wall biosynthesis
MVPPRDPVALSEAWGAALRMGRKARMELGERARARIVTNFSLDEVVRQYEELYTEIIDGAR